MPTRRSKATTTAAAASASSCAESKRSSTSNKRSRAVEHSESDPDSDSHSTTFPTPSENNRALKRAKVDQLALKNTDEKQSQGGDENNDDERAKTSTDSNSSKKPVHWDAQTLSTMNDRLRDELAQVRTELEHSQRLLQLSMGRAPILDDRACQSETTTLIDQYDNIRKSTQIQLSKMKPSHPKYWWWEYAHHLNTEMCRLVRESWTYRGFSV